MTFCLNCNCETSNPKFCSKSCSVTHNNTTKPKRNQEGSCRICNSIISTRYKYCSDCKKAGVDRVDWKSITIEELTNRFGINKHSKIRYHSRKEYFRNYRENSCENCGYNLHIEVCHIKPIKDFKLNSKLAEINSIDNLIALCPNCHWEFDNGLLAITK